jgi:hypothetical protein
MGLRTVIKTAGHWLKGLVFKVDREIQFDQTTNPEVDSSGGSFIWKTQTSNPTSWILKDGTTSENILLVNSSAKTITLNSNYAPIGFGNYGLFSQTVQGSTINTAPEQSVIGTGVGSLSIPANGFTVGDSFHAKLGGVINATGGGGRSEIIIKVKAGATILATTGVFDLDAATNQGWELELDFTITALGATGSISTNGDFVYTKDNARDVYGYIFQDSQVLDTTISNTLDVTVEWNVINGGDDIYCANFVLQKIF